MQKLFLDGLIYTKFRSFRIPFCKKLSASSDLAIKKLLYPDIHDQFQYAFEIKQYFSRSLITNIPSKAELLDLILKRPPPENRNPIYQVSEPVESESSDEEPIIFSKENRFAQVLKCYNLNALPNIHSVDSRLGELLERLPNRGSKSQTQGYEVRDWLKMFCHHWGYQNERMEDAKKEWLTWLSNKDNYSQNEHGYVAEWESFCRHCTSKKGKSYDLPLDYLLAFVHEVEKKFDAKSKASGKKKKITDSLEEQDEREEIFNNEDSVNFIEHEEEVVQQEEERPNRPNFLGYPFEEQKLHRPFSLKDLDFHLTKSPRGVIEDSVENIKIVVDYYNLFCAKIRTIGSILFKTINSRTKLVDYKFVKQYPHFDEHIKIHTRDAKGHLRNLSISVGGWIAKKAIGGLKAYDNITFDTKLSDTECEITSCFNLFRGFPILKELEEGKYQTSDDKCATILEHIRENICHSRKPEEKKALYEHFMKKLATHLRTPGENKTGILLYGQSGSGKGLTTELLKNVFGASNCQYFVTFDQATDKFNSKLSRCCVAFVDEVHGTKNSSKFSQISHTQTRIGAHMKALISEGEIVINPKGVNSYQVPNCIFWFFLTDLLHGLSKKNLLYFSNFKKKDLEPNDRRIDAFFVKGLRPTATEQEKLAKQEFFKKLAEEIKTPEAVASFAQHLLNIDLRGFNPRLVLESSHRNTLVMEGAKDVVLLFFTYIDQFQPNWKQKEEIYYETIEDEKTKQKKEILKTRFIEPPHYDCEKEIRYISVDDYYQFIRNHQTRASNKMVSKSSAIEIAKVICAFLGLELNFKNFIEVPNDWQTFKKNSRLTLE